MEDFSLTKLLLQIAEALSPFFVTLASWAAYQGAAWIRQRVKHEKLQHAADIAAGAVSDVVASTSAATMEAFRAAAEDGEVTREEMIQIRDAALKSAKRHIGSAALNGLRLVSEDPDEWLWTKIKAEAKVQDTVLRKLEVGSYEFPDGYDGFDEEFGEDDLDD